MKNFKRRLIYELLNISESIEKLNDYLCLNDSKLKDKEKELLSEQVKYMYGYRDSLIDRIVYYMKVNDDNE